jgi:hypothetical protein
MKSFHFWQQWLFYSSLAFAASGILFAVYGNNPIFIHYNNALAGIFWNTGNMPLETERFRAFIWAAFGGTIACCYLLLAFIAYYPFKRREKWSWWAIVIGYGVWIIIDSLACIYYQVYFQIYVINLFSFSVKALPLIFTRKYFVSQAF